MLVKKVFNGVFDDEVHNDLIKFGRGDYKNKYLISAKKQGAGKYVVKTGPEYANTLVRMCLPSGKIKVTGVVVSTFDLKGGMGGYVFNPEEETKGFMGIKQIKVNGEIESKRILEVMDKFPRAFFALSFVTPDCELKIKAKAPKSAKPSTKEVESDEDLKIDFCSLKTTNARLIQELFFDIHDFKEILAKHTIRINEIIYPKNEQDPIKMRELSKRKGVLIREVTLDDNKKMTEHDFLA